MIMLVFGHVHTWIIDLLGYELELQCRYDAIIISSFQSSFTFIWAY